MNLEKINVAIIARPGTRTMSADIRKLQAKIPLRYSINRQSREISNKLVICYNRHDVNDVPDAVAGLQYAPVISRDSRAAKGLLLPMKEDPMSMVNAFYGTIQGDCCCPTLLEQMRFRSC